MVEPRLCVRGCGRLLSKNYARHDAVCWFPFTFERFVEIGKCIRTGAGCLEWRKTNRPSGYGVISFPTPDVIDTERAHVASFLYHGGILTPNKPLVLHTCDNPPCIEVSHLYAGSVQDNVNDRVRRNRGPSFEVLSRIGKQGSLKGSAKGGVSSSKIKIECECGLIASPGPMGMHKKHRNHQTKESS